ncbi:ankyrin repeat domain-containing protein [Comamonas sp. Y33R10-2]|uniref:ankyrin repeat domain-containing protein n=1 Tax=Comamonas sp. Y33R10-2 TaxID=2853257 RepID=UPI001C5CB0C7|nr:ankyrin repeat domain-containing protein [Comamonas sp. Y33R10-2]QXZ08427.1 ankyrin repeat domain-containing protein [Comamonas sp. Y33R10-2]
MSLFAAPITTLTSSLNRRQSLRCLGVAVVGAAGLPSMGWANDFDDFSRALVSDNASAMVNLIFRGFDANTLDSRGRPGLVSALHQDSLKVFEVLLKAPKIDVNLASRQNETPLMMACLKGHIKLVKELIKRGADVNREGWAPLHYAASADTPQTLDIIKLLLEESAYIDAASPNGSTPLMMAAQYSSESVVKLLLQEGADLNLRNQLKLNAADFAARVDRQYMVELLNKALKQERRMQPSKGTW